MGEWWKAPHPGTASRRPPARPTGRLHKERPREPRHLENHGTGHQVPAAEDQTSAGEIEHTRDLTFSSWLKVHWRRLESPLDCKEIQPVHPKGNQSWGFNGRTDAEAETPILWLPDVKNWLIGKDPDARKDWREEEKGTTEDEMVGWHHWLDGTWVWVNSGSWWWTGRPGVLWSMGSRRVRHDWATELNWTELNKGTNALAPVTEWGFQISLKWRGSEARLWPQSPPCPGMWPPRHTVALPWWGSHLLLPLSYTVLRTRQPCCTETPVKAESTKGSTLTPVWRVKRWSLRHLFSALSGPVFLSFGLSLFIWASLLAQLVKNPPAMQETPVWFLGQEDPLERGKDTHCSILGLPCGSAGKESACNAGNLGSIPGLGRSPGEGKGNPLQYSGLENSTDCTVHGVATSWTRLTDFHFIYLTGG